MIVVKTREAPQPRDLRQRAAQAETLEAADRAAECGRQRPGAGRALVRRVELSHQEFADIGRLVELKERQGLTISARPAHAQ